MTCKDCIHSGLCYKENDYDNFPDRCGSFISDKVLEEKPQDEQKDIDIPKVCEECHSESYSNGFDAGYELGKEDAQKHIAELNENIEILKYRLEVYKHISNLGDEVETRGDEECRT